MRRLGGYVIVMFLSVLISGCSDESEDAYTEITNEEEILEESTIICIDAGHGFDDPGCESDFMNGHEAEVTFEISRMLKEMLEAEGITVILTHDGNSFPSNDTIIEMANEYSVEWDEERFFDDNIFSAYERAIYVEALNKGSTIDFFLSLHVNSIENYPDVSRYEMYYFEDNASSEFLQRFCKDLADKLDNNTEIVATEKEESYTVTYYTSCPSLLFELGYASNEIDAAKLNSDAWRKSICEKLVEMFIDYSK